MEVVTFYRFMALEDFGRLIPGIRQRGLELELRGTILLAGEGINSTICGTKENLDTMLCYLNSVLPLPILNAKFSPSSGRVFGRFKVRPKKEIVTMGVQGIDPNQTVGTYVSPKDWNSLIDDPQVLVLDTRNSYEVEVGTFNNATTLPIRHFREFPALGLEAVKKSGKTKVAMFCTGGIRCEKASAFFVNNGIETYHLEGGILKYLEEVPEEQSAWKGGCFVFDERVALEHGLEPRSKAE